MRFWRWRAAKGGVGKTTLALGLAAVTADSSGRALVVDIDPQGSAAEVAEAAADGLPFDFAAESDPATLAQLRKARDIDTVIVDLPGSLEFHDVLGQVLAAADLVIIPMVPERAAITPTIRTARLAEEAAVPYAVVLNQVDPLRGERPRRIGVGTARPAGHARFSSLIRRYIAHTQSQLDGVMITNYRGDGSLPESPRRHAASSRVIWLAEGGLADLAGGGGQVGGGERAGFAGQRRGDDGEYVPPAWCIAQRLHLAACQADDLGQEGEGRTAHLAVGHHGGDPLGPVVLCGLRPGRLVQHDAPERATSAAAPRTQVAPMLWPTTSTDPPCSPASAAAAAAASAYSRLSS